MINIKKKTPIFIVIAIIALALLTVGIALNVIDPSFSISGSDDITSDVDKNVTDAPSDVPEQPTNSVYTVYYDCFNGTAEGATRIRKGDTETIKFIPYEGYKLPTNVLVTGCDYNYDKNTGEVVLKNPYDNVTVEVVCIGAYTVLCDAYVNCDVSNGGVAYTVAPMGSVTFEVDPYEGCTLEGADVKVYGNYDGFTIDLEAGTVIISGVYEDISWSITCPRKEAAVKIRYVFPDGGVERRTEPYKHLYTQPQR